MGADRIDHCGLLADEQMARTGEASGHSAAQVSLLGTNRGRFVHRLRQLRGGSSLVEIALGRGQVADPTATSPSNSSGR